MRREICLLAGIFAGSKHTNVQGVHSCYTVTVIQYTCHYVSGTLYKGYAYTVAYTGHVTFYKVLEKHGHVYLVGLDPSN